MGEMIPPCYLPKRETRAKTGIAVVANGDSDNVSVLINNTPR
jgi:hypothetical protein